MLTPEQQEIEVTLTAQQVWTTLQVYSRVISSGALKDIEVTPVGQARDALVAALQKSTDINFDQAKAQLEAIQRQRLLQAQKEAAEKQAADAADVMAPEGDVPPDGEPADLGAEALEVLKD